MKEGGFQIANFKFQSSDFKFQISNFRSQIQMQIADSDSKCRFRFRLQIQMQIADSRFEICYLKFEIGNLKF